MFFFRVNQRVELERQGMRQVLLPAKSEMANYVTSMYDYFEIRHILGPEVGPRRLDKIPDEDWYAENESPLELGMSNRGEYERKRIAVSGKLPPRTAWKALENQFPELRGRDTLKFAIINGFGVGVGDTLVGLTAWRSVRERFLAAGFRNFETEMWVRPSALNNARDACELVGTIDRINVLPMPIQSFQNCDAFWDLSGLIDRPNVSKRATVDFFLELLGIDPTGVQRSEKRNHITLPLPVITEVVDRLQGITSRYIIVNPKSGDLRRDMPLDVFRELCALLVNKTDCDVATLVPMPKVHDRQVDLSPISGKGFKYRCAVVKRAQAVVTVDSSLYHIADAFDVPSVVIFATISPKLRIPYYPSMEGVPLPGLEDSQPSTDGGEDQRIDVTEMLRRWSQLNTDSVVQRLTDLMSAIR
ncbi:MAG: hypothetical protein JSW21_08250 [Gammaproteobacteria bacterium]|nr:MAG: hypothetical protein JSW21_08250 [Gammaproteobacteria bacterium]